MQHVHVSPTSYSRRRDRRAIRAVAAALIPALLLTTASLLLPPPTAAAADPTPIKGIQFGQPINLNSRLCDRNTPVNLLLDNPAILAQTAWVRIDLRGAGNPDEQACDVDGDVDVAYQLILNALKAHGIRIIGLLSNEFIARPGPGPTPIDEYAASAQRVACDQHYQNVDVWEIWNEPNEPSLSQRYLDPWNYAHYLTRASFNIRSCNADPVNADKVISGGVNASEIIGGVNAVIDYLLAVDQAIRDDHFDPYADLDAAVDGIGVHPYFVTFDRFDELLWAVHTEFAQPEQIPIYITEFGWQNSDLGPMKQCSNLVYEFNHLNPFGQWATKDLPAAIWFTMQDFPDDTHGLYDLTAVPRPALTGYVAETCPPMTPTNPTAIPLNATSVQVSWTDNSSNETGFEVYNGVSYASVGANVTSYTWTGIAPGTYMCFAVHAYNGEGSSPDTPYACTVTPTVPATPSNLTATPLDGTQIQVTWTDNSTDETGFAVSNGVTTVDRPADTTQYTWTDLTPGTYMCFQVRADNADGSSPWSTQACTTTPTVPAAPTGQTATPANGTSIRITWTDRSSNEAGFQIWNGAATVTVAANSTAYTWTGLANGTYMCFAVRSYNLAGASAYTPWACTTTPTVPAAPTGQTATPDSGTSIRIAWTDRSTNENGFEIWNGVTSRYVSADVTAFSWTGLANGTYMCFTIRAYNLAGPSAPTPWACATTPTVPAAPASPTATAISTSQIRVSWQDRSTNETGFQIYNGVTTISVGANVTSYTWGGLAQGTYMCFAIRSYNLAGSSPWTPYACTTTPTVPAAPTGQAATAISTSQIRVSWQDRSTNETGFQIYNGVTTISVGANVTSYTWGGLAQGTYMCFAIRSYNLAGSSPWTPYACTTTPTVPAAPTGQAATAISTSQIRVSWQDRSTNETGFQIYDGVNYFTVGANVTTFYRTGLASRTYMCFAIRSYNAYGYSAWTPYACATTF